jgi:hypothetical protein
MTAACEQHKQEIDALVRPVRENVRPWNVGDAERYDSYCAIQKLSGMEMTRDDHSDPLVNG